MKRLFLVFAIAALLTAGCGGSSSSSSSSSTSSSSGGATAPATGGGGGNNLTLATDPNQFAFNTKTLTAKAGKVTITMTNKSATPHDIALKGGVNATGKVVGQGQTSTVTATLKPGNYTFYCSVPGHEAAGMNGELIVK